MRDGETGTFLLDYRAAGYDERQALASAACAEYLVSPTGIVYEIVGEPTWRERRGAVAFPALRLGRVDLDVAETLLIRYRSAPR
jgi:hypothetical protein